MHTLCQLGLLLLTLAAGALLAPSRAAATTTSASFLPVADTFVNSAHPATSYGVLPTICAADGRQTKHAYLRFDLGALPPDAEILSATLRLYATTNALGGGTIAAMGGGDGASWNEATTWDTRPQVGGPLLATLGSVASGEWITASVTHAITGSGSFAFALLPSTGARTSACYAAREYSVANAGAAYRPLLRLSYRLPPQTPVYPPPDEQAP
jgi:acid phosphatase type 7